MRNFVLGVALSFTVICSSSAENVVSTDIDEIQCANFSELLSAAQNLDILDRVATLVEKCPDFGDQIVEESISLTSAEQHQEIMQIVADTGVMSPADILLSAIAGGGDIASLSEPTAAGNLAIVPPSSATAPPIIGGRNGGITASGN